MTDPNCWTADRPHDVRRTCLVGIILGGTLLGAAIFAGPASLGFSLNLRVEHVLFHVEVTRGTAHPKANGTVHAV